MVGSHRLKFLLRTTCSQSNPDLFLISFGILLNFITFYRSFSIIQKNNEAVLKSIVTDPSVDPKLQNFYSSCMNLTAIEGHGIKAVYSMFDLIDGIDGVSILDCHIINQV